MRSRVDGQRSDGGGREHAAACGYVASVLFVWPVDTPVC